ncbi:Uncharacterised protein [Mycobacterium tuberculosis]|uniref:Uncharacterized protein n=2 Tax=Mycobacterium tuberculosis TaxID=1773 RepID=A0A0T9YJJ6_MYCTX|nr:Uncharacterised protein [Mycobacterium tuberculosis]CFE78324.1 Uncharacterised protein [Mycobacterium tuberculosis]CKT10325.1 Uncharacterised protein [Mycobacterium tuberculosis]CNV51294.1 Uncharacterised protein [Mycobacterium tuberculosis]COW78480.1 Uncharacterised protein [Mycobacterium tuberculosis]
MTAAPAAVMAQSPTRRSTLAYALEVLCRSGIRTSIRTSLWASAVSYGPTRKSSIAISRSPEGPFARHTASRTVHTVDRSSAGSAWQSEPPRVPRLRTTGSAITRSASRKIGHTAASASESRISRWRVIAPSRTRLGLLIPPTTT